MTKQANLFRQMSVQVLNDRSGGCVTRIGTTVFDAAVMPIEDRWAWGGRRPGSGISGLEYLK